MRDFDFGRIDGRHLKVRVLIPLAFQDWNGEPQVSWRRLLNPLRWWRAIRGGWSSFHLKRFTDANYRCYCDVGSAVNGRFVLFGMGVQFWYSHFTGDMPCWCDKVLEELAGETCDSSVN